MPFTINSPNLPDNVKKADAKIRRQWIEIWNAAYKKCNDGGGADCESAAFRQANSVLRKAIGMQQEETMKFAELLKTLAEASDEMKAALGDLRASIEAIELDEGQGGDVMDKLKVVEALFLPKDDEDEEKPEDDEEEPVVEETEAPEAETETTGEAFAESLTGSIELAEADPPASPRDPLAIKMRLIKAGPGNPHDNHYYPGDVLRRDAHVFEGVKMYTTPHNESERSEDNEVAKIRKITGFEEDGSPIADVLIFDPAFAEKTRNRAKEGELNSLECSILAQGVAKEADIDGETYNVVESIESAQAVDFVPKAGAGAKALSIAESEAGTGEQPETPETPEPDPPKPLLEKEQVLSVLRETNLPGPSQERLADGEYGNDAALAEAITKETEYVKAVSGSGQPLGAGATEPAEPKTETIEERRKRDAEWYENERIKHGLSPR